MLYKEIDAEMLRDEFKAYGRDSFTTVGYKALIEYYSNNLEDDTELDVVAIDCEFSEATEDEVRSDYDIEDEEPLEYLLNNTYAIKLSNGNILYRIY